MTNLKDVELSKEEKEIYSKIEKRANNDGYFNFRDFSKSGIIEIHFKAKKLIREVSNDAGRYTHRIY